MSFNVIFSRFGSPSSFSRRITGTMLLVLFVAMLGSAIGYWSLSHVSAETGRMVDSDMATERVASELSRHISVNIARAKALALSSEPEVGVVLIPEIEQTAGEIDALLKQLKSMLTGSAEKEILTSMLDGNIKFLGAFQALTVARDGGVTSRIEQVVTQVFTPAALALQAAIAQLDTTQRTKIDNSVLGISDLSQRARWGLVLFSACALLLGGLLSVWLVRSITRPVQRAVATANQVAALDLTAAIEGHDRDEAGRLLLALGRMQSALNAMVTEVQGASQSVAAGATQIAASNSDFSNRTEMSASFLQMTAASVEEITASMHASLEAAAEGESLAQSTAVLAAEGSAVMYEVMQTMNDISSSSRQIMDITGVIDSIAFQTNILALNAAVEAARAGDQGRGFAVVAAEVRILANRSAVAAKEIKQLIGSSADKVKLGTDKVGMARDTMKSITESASRVAQALGQITTGSRDQSNSMADINESINRLDQMTQQNAAVVEESAAAAKSLQNQASDLRDVVGRFRLPGLVRLLPA